MKNIIFLATLVAAVSFSAFTFTVVTSYKISDDYSIKFDGRGAAGTFTGLTGDIIFDEKNLSAAHIQVSVDATTISTGNATKDKHARGENWFDTKNYQKINFTSETFTKTTEGYAVTGIFEIHGFKKQETIPFTFKNNVFEGKVMINRQEYGIEGPFFSFTVSDEFEVSLRIPVSQ